MIKAEEQFLDSAKACAIGIDWKVQVLSVLGTMPYPSKFCCTSCTMVLGVKPASSMANEYNKGLMVEPTCLFVFVLT